VDIGPRSSASVVFTPSVTTPGSRTFVAVADPAGALVEADEDNNRASVRVANPANTIDLEILPADVAASSTDLVAGDVLTVTATVHNRGTGAVPDVAVQLGHDGTGGVGSLSERHVSIPAGGSASVNLSWTASLLGDPLPLVVRVDPFGTLPELFEDNNSAPLSVRVRPSALTNLRLTGADVSFDPPAPREGATVVIAATVHNPSPVAAPAFTVRFFHGNPDDGGEQIGERRVTGVDAASSAVASIEWLLDVRGSQAIFVVADALDEVPEYDETDNRAFRSVGVLGIADLVLAVADVRLTPEYPHAGEPVTISATVRNLGAQPSLEASLAAYEGQPLTGSSIGKATIPPLAPGEAISLSLAWSPAEPSGSRTLSLVADAGKAVPEQDEGNNVVRRTVVVQNADLYLSEPYFSPNGDDVKDETVLAYRATGTGTVAIAVSDAGGRKVRTLVSDGPAVGSTAWDGRDDGGALVRDGAYTLTVSSATGQVLGRVVATLDTNRSTLFDAAGTGLLSTGQNLTCSLPDFDLSSGESLATAWMPGDDELLFIGRLQGDASGSLVRVGLDGTTRRLAAPGTFASVDPVSPDGREVLLTDFSNLFAMDLTTGASRMLGPHYATQGVWSPDGQLIATDYQIVRRDGSVVADLHEYVNDAKWSPDGEFVAFAFGYGGGGGILILRKDGSEVRRFDEGTVTGLAWRGDGKLVVQALVFCGSECATTFEYTLDPVTGESRPLSWLDEGPRLQAWSADGSRLLYGDNSLATAREDGSEVIPIFPTSVRVSPRATAFLYTKGPSDSGTPGPAACPGKQFDTFAVVNIQNLTAELNVERLPGNSGLLLHGTVSDAALDHFEIEYATTGQPGIWHPIGTGSEVPVIDDTLAAFVPPSPGTYVIRLTASDRAGNVRTRARVVSWDTFPVIANLTQDEFLISPNHDRVEVAVTVSYLVAEPTGLDVRIVGPRPSAETNSVAPTVRSFHLDYSAGDIGTQSFGWDGRDEGGQVVRDGKYTVLLNDIPLRVDVDATPPDIAWAYENLRVDDGALVADRVWHVVDPNLKHWSLSETALQGTEPIFVPDRNASGELILENGALRPKRDGTQAASVRLRDEDVAALGVHEGAVFTAADHAGNQTTVPAFPVDERLFMKAQIDPDVVYAFPPTSAIGFAETLRPPDASVVFEYRRRDESTWHATPPLEGNQFTVSFLEMGLDPKKEYRGRFTGAGSTGEVSSEELLFQPCAQKLTLEFLPPPNGPSPIGPGLIAVPLLLDVEVAESVIEASYYVEVDRIRRGPFPMRLLEVRGRHKIYLATYVGPGSVFCDDDPLRPVAFFGFVKTASGKVFDGRTNDKDSCVELRNSIPAGCSPDGFGLDMEQEYRSCAESSPDLGLPEGEGQLHPERYGPRSLRGSARSGNSGRPRRQPGLLLRSPPCGGRNRPARGRADHPRYRLQGRSPGLLHERSDRLRRSHTAGGGDLPAVGGRRGLRVLGRGHGCGHVHSRRPGRRSFPEARDLGRAAQG
jgi:flagellar hook assembly protein FlgD